MPDTTLHGYRLDEGFTLPPGPQEPESGTLFGYPAPQATPAYEPGRQTQPEPALELDVAPVAPPVAQTSFDDARASGPLPPVISESMAWSDDAPAATEGQAWSESRDEGVAFANDEPLPTRPAGLKSGPPLGLLVGGGLAALLAAGAACAFLFAGRAEPEQARIVRRAPPTAVAAAPAAPSPIAAIAGAPQRTGAVAEAAGPAAPPAARPAVAARASSRAASGSSEATRSVTAAPARSGGGRVASRTGRSRRAVRDGVPSLDDAPLAGGEPPSFDLGSALAPLTGATAPAAQPTPPGVDPVASLGRADDDPTPVSAPPPVVAPSRPGDEVDWGVPFGG